MYIYIYTHIHICMYVYFVFMHVYLLIVRDFLPHRNYFLSCAIVCGEKEFVGFKAVLSDNANFNTNPL